MHLWINVCRLKTFAHWHLSKYGGEIEWPHKFAISCPAAHNNAKKAKKKKDVNINNNSIKVFASCTGCNDATSYTRRERKREKKRIQQGISYNLFYTILFHPVCVLIDNAVFASPISPPHKKTNHGYLMWLFCGSAQCPPSAHPVTPYLYSSLIAFSHSSCVKCRKNRYPLINSKAVKILSSTKRLLILIRSVEPVTVFMKRKGWAFR